MLSFLTLGIAKKLLSVDYYYGICRNKCLGGGASVVLNRLGEGWEPTGEVIPLDREKFNIWQKR